MTLKTGYAQQTITLALDRPVYLAGFGRNRRAETIHAKTGAPCLVQVGARLTDALNTLLAARSS